MIKCAIVGNIASGKTEIIEKQGYIVFDTDFITHDILTDNPKIAQEFIDYDVFEHGRLSREKLGKLVFSQPDLLRKLEDIVHPLILDEVEQIFKTYTDEDVIFISVPLLFEVGWERMFDKIIFIKADDDIRLERLISRNGYDKEYALKRINSQLPQEEKEEKSDFVIKNNSSVEELKAQVEKILQNILPA